MKKSRRKVSHFIIFNLHFFSYWISIFDFFSHTFILTFFYIIPLTQLLHNGPHCCLRLKLFGIDKFVYISVADPVLCSPDPRIGSGIKLIRIRVTQKYLIRILLICDNLILGEKKLFLPFNWLLKTKGLQWLFLFSSDRIRIRNSGLHSFSLNRFYLR